MNTLQTTLSALQAQSLSQKEVLQNYSDGVFDKNIAALEVEIADFIGNKAGIDELTLDATEGSIKFTNSSIIIKPLNSDAYSNQINLYYRSSYSEDVSNDKVELSWYGSSCGTKDIQNLEYLSILGKVAGILSEIEKEYIGKWQIKYQHYIAARQVYSSEYYKTQEAIRQIEKQIKTSELKSYKQVGFKCVIANHDTCVRNYEISKGEVGDWHILSQNRGIKLQYSYSKYDYANVYAFEIISKGPRNKMTLRILANQDVTSPIYREYSLTEKFFNEFIKEVFDWQTVSAITLATDARASVANRCATKQESAIA